MERESKWDWKKEKKREKYEKGPGVYREKERCLCTYKEHRKNSSAERNRNKRMSKRKLGKKK